MSTVIKMNRSGRRVRKSNAAVVPVPSNDLYREFPTDDDGRRTSSPTSSQHDDKKSVVKGKDDSDDESKNTRLNIHLVELEDNPATTSLFASIQDIVEKKPPRKKQLSLYNLFVSKFNTHIKKENISMLLKDYFSAAAEAWDAYKNGPDTWQEYCKSKKIVNTEIGFECSPGEVPKVGGTLETSSVNDQQSDDDNWIDFIKKDDGRRASSPTSNKCVRIILLKRFLKKNQLLTICLSKVL